MMKISVDTFAKILCCDKAFVRNAIQHDCFNFAFAIKNDSRYTYYINPVGLSLYTGLSIEQIEEMERERRTENSK